MSATDEPTLRPRLFLSRDVEIDYLSAIEFGSVDDGQPDDAWRVVTRWAFCSKDRTSAASGFG